MDAGMEFARRPEELAKSERLPERPPTPDPENQAYETRNLGAVASNSDTPQSSLASKPAFSVTTPPVAEDLGEVALQPVQGISTVIAAHRANGDCAEDPSSMGQIVAQNGDGSATLSATNGLSSNQMNGKLDSPQASTLPQMESTIETLGYPAASSSLPLSSSFDSFAPSATHLDTQETITATTPQDILESVSSLPPTLEQPPISNLRLSPHSLPQDSETALRIKNDRHDQDLANDAELAQGLATGGNAPIERKLTPQIVSTIAEGQPTIASVMDTTSDPLDQEAHITNHALPVSPPPAPEPAHATLPVDPPQPFAHSFAAPEIPDHLQVDQPMIDAPSPQGKISRERDEEGDEDGPAAKRLKAEDEIMEPEFKVPEVPTHSPPADQRTTDLAPPADDTVTGPRLTHMKKVIANLKKSSISQPFREPVDPESQKIPTYFDIIKQPMDLGTVDRRLKSSKYDSVADFVADFNLIVDNTITFNGNTHAVSLLGLKMRQSFQNQMKALPPASFTLPAKDEKKSAKAKEHPVRTVSQRRPSVPQASAVSASRSPATPGATTTFALGPEGMPLIRRDSTVADGRPKRAIHPPKRRDHEFGPGRPRKKKFEWQLKFCKEVITEMKKPKHYSFAQFFYFPVDPVALNIPSYHKIVKKPMDMESVERKLDTNQYEKARDFEEDVRQIFKNCFIFNQSGDFVFTCGQQLEKVFEDKWATKDEWLASHEPASEPQSPGDEDEDEEASEEEDDESADERSDEIAQLKAQIAMMSQTIGNLTSAPKKKKKNTPPAPAVSKKSGKTKKKEKPASFPALQQTGKDKKKSFSKSKPEKEHFVTYNEKQYISTGISSLPDARMSEALKIIQSNVPSLKNTHETEIELDIDELPNHVLLKLLNFVKKYGEHAPPEPEPAPQPGYAPPASAPGKPKKNKPMSKQEQEQQIRELKGKLGVYDGGQISPDPLRSVENAVDSSGDDDSEESEEE